MSDAETFFGMSSIHVLMAALGAAVFIAYLLPRIYLLRATSSSAILMILGLLAFTFVPGLPAALDPTVSPRFFTALSTASTRDHLGVREPFATRSDLQNQWPGNHP
jgi:hypothetical protein